MTVVANRSFSIMCFHLDINGDISSPLVPPVACHCNMDVFGSSRKILQNCYIWFWIPLCAPSWQISSYQNAKQDADYLKTTQLEKELNN